jgi:predicted ATPase
MIRRLSLKDYRNHADTTLVLGPMTLLVGPSGAGKSNLFKALVLLQNSLHRTLAELFPPGLGEFHWVRSRFADETASIGFEVELDELREFPGESALYSLAIADGPRGLYVHKETLQRRRGKEPWEWVFRRFSKLQSISGFGEVDPEESPTLLNLTMHPGPKMDRKAPAVRFGRAVSLALSRVGYFHLMVSNLKALGNGQPVEHLDYYGSRMPDFLAWTREAEEAAGVFKTIEGELREILPTLDKLMVTQVDVERQGIALALRGHRGTIAAPDLSDGTLLTLGLLCVLHGPKPPHLLCIEEPENGLHPRRLRWLFDRLLGLAYPSGKTAVQVLLTTHSPQVVDLFRDMQDAVQVVESVEGRARVTSLREVRAKLHDEGDDVGIGQAWATGLFEGL